MLAGLSSSLELSSDTVFLLAHINNTMGLGSKVTFWRPDTMAMDSYTGYSDLEGETGSHDEQLSPSSSEAEESDVELPSLVCDKRQHTNYSTDQVLDDLFHFDTGGMRKKRYRAPSDSVDKGQPSKQSRSSLPSNFGHEKRSKMATLKTPSRTP